MWTAKRWWPPPAPRAEEPAGAAELGYETADTVNAYFAEEVDIRQEYVESSYVMNLGYIAEILNETKEGEVTYTVTSGDSYYSIAEKYDLSVEALMKLNSGYDPKILRVGDVLTISNAVPYLTVVNVERQRYVQDGAVPGGVHRRRVHVSG